MDIEPILFKLVLDDVHFFIHQFTCDSKGVCLGPRILWKHLFWALHQKCFGVFTDYRPIVLFCFIQRLVKQFKSGIDRVYDSYKLPHGISFSSFTTRGGGGENLQ